MSDDQTPTGASADQAPTGANTDQTPTGANPYTDPPPFALQRFHEDPRPIDQASEQQVLQGRGHKAPYPGHEPRERGWQPDTYADQKSHARPDDCAPSPADAYVGITIEQLVALPPDLQEKVLGDVRARFAAGAPPASTGSAVQPSPTGSGVMSMAPASPGTVIAGDGPADTIEAADTEPDTSDGPPHTSS